MKKSLLVLASAAVVLTMLVTSLVTNMSYSLPALAAVPTPLPFNQTLTQETTAVFFNRAPLTADTRICLSTLARNNYGEIQYVIDQGVANSTTLSMQHSNNNLTFEDGASMVAANAADAHAMLRVQLMGRYNCVLANVSSTNTVTITAILNGK